MTKTKLILLLTLVLVFAAGASAGWLVARWPRPPRSWLSDELHLTPEQREQMRAIWATLPNPWGEGERRQTMAKERDDALQALLTDEQRKRYQEIQDEYERKLEEMAQARRTEFEAAVARTQEILTPEQRSRYEEMQRAMRERGGGPPRGEGRPWPGRGEAPPPWSGGPRPGPMPGR